MRAMGAASVPGLHCEERRLVGDRSVEYGLRHTCPPEKPTATRPSSLGLSRNLVWMVLASMLLRMCWSVSSECRGLERGNPHEVSQE